MAGHTKTAGHLSLFGANAMWGIMAPISKLLLAAGVISGTALADMRILSGTLLFWIFSLFARKEKIDKGDYLKLLGAAFFSTALNQILFVNGVALTSPIDAGMCTSTLPIWTMIFSALYLKERLTGGKISGILIGLCGAFLLIFQGARPNSASSSNLLGDLLCIGSQISYSIYLVFFQDIIRKYSPVTLMKWKYLFGAIMLLPLSMGSLTAIGFTDFTRQNWSELAYILACGTFLSYLIVPIGQKALRPTVVAMYNYLQPTFATLFAFILGQDTLTPMKIAAIILIFIGVMLVNKSRDRDAS